MRVLVVIDSLRLGGAENVLIGLAKVAPSAGIDVQVVSLAEPEGPAAALRRQLEAVGVRPTFLSLPRLVAPGAVPSLVRSIRASGCDVVHAHLEHSSTLAPVAAALARRPAVCTFHQLAGNLAGRAAAKERLAITAASRSRAAVFVSEACRSSFTALHRPRSTWRVVPNGVDLSDFVPEPAPLPADLPVPPRAPVVAVVAALRPPKGHATAVAAWPRVLQEVPEARLLVVGAGETGAELRRQVAELDLGDRVVFAGARTDVPHILRAVDLVVLPTHTEALPTALMEAAAAGRAVVASAVGGVPEVVVDGVTGLTVPPRDPVALASAVASLLRDGGRREAMGRAARQRALSTFDVRVWASSLRQLYDEVAGS